MHSWTGGYAADIEYVSNYYPQMSPHHMHAVATLNGWAPAPLAPDFTYCELGCGTGHSLAVLAAANPQARFVGMDFMPDHALAAQQLAAKSGLDNVAFIEASFQDLLDRPDRLPQCDVIALHGVWSWVSAESRRAIVRLIGRHLKTGGLVYVSFNSLPGQEVGRPIQRLLFELARLHPGRSDVRLRHALAMIDRLAEAGAEAVKDNQIYKKMKEQAGKGRFNYLVHEYLNASWDPMYFADVAAALAEAKLGFVGPGDMVQSFRSLNVTPEQAAVLDEIADPVLRETVADYCSVDGFRRDVFARGARRLSQAEQDRALRQTRLCLTAPPDSFTYSVKVALGEASMNEAAYRPMFAALSEGPRSIDELMELPDVRANANLQAGEVLGMMVASNYAAVALPADWPTAADGARGLNRAVAESALAPGPVMGEALVAPVLGGGLPTDLMRRLLFRALDKGVAAEPEALADAVIPMVLARGEQILRDDQPIEEPDERRAHVADGISAFIADWLPLWRQLGIV